MGEKKGCQIQEFVLYKNEFLMSSAGHKVKEAGRELDLVFGSQSENLPTCSTFQKLRLVILGKLPVVLLLPTKTLFLTGFTQDLH